MPKLHSIAMDTHGQTTDICCKTSVQAKARRWRVPTTIPALREVIEAIRRPRHHSKPESVGSAEDDRGGARTEGERRRGESP